MLQYIESYIYIIWLFFIQICWKKCFLIMRFQKHHFLLFVVYKMQNLWLKYTFMPIYAHICTIFSFNLLNLYGVWGYLGLKRLGFCSKTKILIYKFKFWSLFFCTINNLEKYNILYKEKASNHKFHILDTSRGHYYPAKEACTLLIPRLLGFCSATYTRSYDFYKNHKFI